MLGDVAEDPLVEPSDFPSGDWLQQDTFMQRRSVWEGMRPSFEWYDEVEYETWGRDLVVWSWDAEKLEWRAEFGGVTVDQTVLDRIRAVPDLSPGGGGVGPPAAVRVRELVTSTEPVLVLGHGPSQVEPEVGRLRRLGVRERSIIRMPLGRDGAWCDIAQRRLRGVLVRRELVFGPVPVSGPVRSALEMAVRR